MKSVKRHLSVGFSWAAALCSLSLGLCTSACIAEQAEDDVEVVASPDDAYAPTAWPVDGDNGSDWMSSSDIVDIMKASGPAFTSLSPVTPHPDLASIDGPEVLAYDFMINTPEGQTLTYGNVEYPSRGFCAMSYPPTIELRKNRINLLMLLTNPNQASVPVTLADNVCLIPNSNNILFVPSNVVPSANLTAPAAAIRHSGNPKVRFELAIYNRSVITVNENGQAGVTSVGFDVWTSFAAMSSRGVDPVDDVRKRLCGKNLASCVTTPITVYNSDESDSTCHVKKSGEQILSPGVLCTKPGVSNYLQVTVSLVDVDFWPMLWDAYPM